MCPALKGFPGGSDGIESACSAGDAGSIPGLGRSPGEGKGYPFQFGIPSFNLSQHQGLFWLGKFHGLYNPWGHKESDTTG